MAGGDLLGTSVSGLLAFQRGLAVTGHNVTNASTPGYSRQRVELVTRPPTPSGDGYIGNGVQIDTVARVIDGFLTGQMNAATAANSQLQEYYRLASQVDNMLADPAGGLAPSLQRFFNAVNDVADDPTSTPARQALLSEARSLADRFHYLDTRLEDLSRGVNVQVTNSVNEINELAASIARLNADIALSRGAALGQPPNDLLDKRDELVRRLAEKVNVTTVPQGDGSLSVFIGTGQTLVTGNTANRLQAVNNAYDPTRKDVALVAGSLSVNVTALMTGGALGGVLQFRSEVLDPARNSLGRTAIGLSASFNAQHYLGQDLNNALGGDFFRTLDLANPVGSPRVLSNSAATVTVSVTDINALTTSDYLLDYDGANYSLLRISDSTLVYSGAAFPPPTAVDGLSFTLAGAPAAGDSFLVQPTRAAARDFAVAISDPGRIAIAGPIRTAEAASATGVPTNLGTGRIGPATVTSTTGLPLAANITLTFDANAGGAGVPGFIVAGGPASPILYDPATESAGKSFTFVGYGDMTFTVSGVPQAGDGFVISNNIGGASDNRNGLALAGLRDQSLLGNGTASYETSYGELVADVGARTRRAEINADAQLALLNRVTAERESVSGVNLDEEAANMMRYQQAYEAAAQMIAVSDTLFQTLLAAVRR